VFDFKIIHKKGKENVLANSLLRKEEEPSQFAISMEIPIWMKELKEEWG